jgi:fatty aldehyde decarbonylase
LNSVTTSTAHRPNREQESIEKLMGLAIFGEKVAAKIYLVLGELRPEYAALLKEFARMEAKHGAWFLEASRANGIEPDRAFADNELNYLLEVVDEYHAAADFDALVIVQGFIVESLAIATYESFLPIAHKFPGTHDAFAKALEEEHYHVDWVVRYLRLRYFDATEEFRRLAERANIKGIDCIGGTMMNISEYLDTIGMSGAHCAGAMMDGYTRLLESVGFEQKDATKHVVGMFMPLIRKYRRGEKTK